MSTAKSELWVQRMAKSVMTQAHTCREPCESEVWEKRSLSRSVRGSHQRTTLPCLYTWCESCTQAERRLQDASQPTIMLVTCQNNDYLITTLLSPRFLQALANTSYSATLCLHLLTPHRDVHLFHFWLNSAMWASDMDTLTHFDSTESLRMHAHN